MSAKTGEVTSTAATRSGKVAFLAPHEGKGPEVILEILVLARKQRLTAAGIRALLQLDVKMPAPFFSSFQAKLLERVSSTIKLLTGLVTGLKTEDEDSSEVLQVVNYGMGGHYEPHVDYFGDSSGIDDRAATMLFYLTDNVVGGATVFPFLGAYIRPTKGSAAFWFNTMRNGQGDLLTIHAGCPVVGGTKWIANLWIRSAA